MQLLIFISTLLWIDIRTRKNHIGPCYLNSIALIPLTNLICAYINSVSLIYYVYICIITYVFVFVYAHPLMNVHVFTFLGTCVFVKVKNMYQMKFRKKKEED